MQGVTLRGRHSMTCANVVTCRRTDWQRLTRAATDANSATRARTSGLQSVVSAGIYRLIKPRVWLQAAVSAGSCLLRIGRHVPFGHDVEMKSTQGVFVRTKALCAKL